MNKLMSGAITQCASVGVYNDLFNELLTLTAEDSTNGTVLTHYMNGLKTAVHVATLPSIKAQPNITFEEHQALMVEMDELLQQANQNTAAASTSQGSRSMNRGRNTAPSLTPGASGSTPVKTQAAKNIIWLIPEERDRLWKIGACF